MHLEAVQQRVKMALAALEKDDWYLLRYDLSERCIAARLALHLQSLFPDHSVDVEYNRVGRPPKRLHIPEQCANYRGKNGEALAVPDVIIHRRGPEGPNLLVLELKKTSNLEGSDCDRERVRAFRAELGYLYGALIECETREGHDPRIRVSEWLHD